jgi:hypothetical protein
MKKKIHPKDQTKELNRAKLEFITRNEKELQKIKELHEKNEKKREEFINNLTSIMGMRSKEYKDAWDLLLREQPFDKEFKEKLKEIKIPPAANAVYPFENFAMELAYNVMAKGGEDIFHRSKDTRNEKYLDYLCQHAREIFTELTNGEPSSYLLVGIDLKRSKDVIINEFENLPMVHNLSQIKALTTKMTEKRLKWLPDVDELCEVWDLYDRAGKQPAKMTFKQIAKKVNRPLSTIKDQWRTTYEKIYHIPYNPESKYVSEEKRADATQLCAKCPHITPKGVPCYKGGEQYPCAEYLKIAGKERIVKQTEYNDNILYGNSDD